VWRAGANENTTISFSKEVIMMAESFRSTYGLHMIPMKMIGRLFSTKTPEPGEAFSTKKKTI